MILHHYELSPFSEKIRLMLGYCNLSWQSVISPAMPPRPNVDPLAGGYRRIPVAQMGADIFCDTRIISAEIAQLAAKPELAKENCDKIVSQFVDYVELEFFFAVLNSATALESIGSLLRNYSPWQAIKFIKDRVGVAKQASVTMLSQREAQLLVDKHLADMEQRLEQKDFLFGANPNVADFSAYHAVWMRDRIGGKPISPDLPRLRDWYQRMAAFGCGSRSELSPQAAFAEAQEHAPRTLPAKNIDDENMGKQVKIQPSDYAKDAVSGTLVGSTDTRWILARETDELGTLHVHFPKQGFTLSAEFV